MGHATAVRDALTLLAAKSTSMIAPVSYFLWFGLELSHVLLGLGLINVGLPGITPRSIAKAILIKPEMPAAGSEWPMLLLI